MIPVQITEEQKAMIVAAEDDTVRCEAEEKGGMFAAVIKIVKAPGVTGTAARTNYVYADADEAEDVAEKMLQEIVDGAEAPEAELAEEDEVEPVEPPVEPEPSDPEPNPDGEDDGEGNS